MARLQDEKFSKGLETVRALMLHPEFEGSLGASIRAEGGAQRAVEALKREFNPPPEMEGVVVPDVDAKEMMEMIQAHTKDWLEIDPRYFGWDFFDGSPDEKLPRAGRGRTFRVERWCPQKQTNAGHVRDHYFGNARGHAAAFVSWLALTKLEDGLYVCATHDEAYFRASDGAMFIPYANITQGKGTLGFSPVWFVYEEYHEVTYVAFGRIRTGQRVLWVK